MSVLATVAAVLLAIGCGSGDDTSGTGTADANPADALQLTFDGDSCAYEGPTELAAGPATLTFINSSDEPAFMEIAWHTGDETAQDAIDYVGEEPTSKFHPSWTREVLGAYNVIEPGETFLWEGELEPAIHQIVCGMSSPNRVWLANVVTVTG